jgi:Mg/Co/Ni transporter MgtE
VVDDNNILIGRITIDDVVDIIRDQAEHQALGAAGLDEDEDLFSPVRRAFRRRLMWLSSTCAPPSSPPAWSASSKAPSTSWWRWRC